MNIVTYLIGKFLRLGKFGKALALLPILGRMKLSDVLSGVRRLVKYLGSGKARKRDILLVVVVVAYLFSPFNLAFLPFGGFFFDMVVIISIISYLNRRAESFCQEQS